MIQFRQKQFGVLSDTVDGAKVGALVGALATKIPFFRKGDKNNWAEDLAIVGGGTIIGAGLGLLVGLSKEITKKTNRIATVDRRLMQNVVDALKKTGFKEGYDFTRDPKTANELKTKVCIVISKESNNLSLLINTVLDAKLKTITNGMIKNIPNTATVNTKLSDKYNDISISTISDSSANTGLIAGIAEYFIRHKYPVYLVEVG